MDKKYLQGYVEKAEDQDGILQVAVASDETPDRQGEIVKAEGWDFKNFKKNPVLLWSHNAGFGEQKPPIGKITDVRTEGKKLLFKPVFDMADEFAADIYRKFKDGFLNAFSVGFIPLERDDKNEAIINAAELLEISAVNIPANPKALVSLREAGLPVSKDFEDWEKGVVENPEALPFFSLKPFPNEHACRIREPGDFQEGSFRSSSRDSDGKKYRVIMGRLKEETTMTEQSFRYPKDVWNADDARKHCKAHDGKTFERATGESSQESVETEDLTKDEFSEKEILQEIYMKVEAIEKNTAEKLDKETIKEVIKEVLPKSEPIKEATKNLDGKTEKTFTDEDLKGSLVLADKALELAFKKMKSLKGGENK